jgi:selenocysteine lyase/cysteine desulfurase
MAAAKAAEVEKLQDWREEFIDLDNRIYLDCANHGPFPRATVRAVEQALELKKYPERITHEFYFELPAQVRASLAKLISAKPTEIALTTGATDGANIVARGLAWRPGDEIVLPTNEFPANYYPWKSLERRGVRVREVAPADGRFVAADDLLAAVGERTRLVAASFVGYADGNRIDIARLSAGCRARGVLVFVDASQGVGALDLRAQELGCDFLTCCGYKWLLSPYGTGFFYLREELIERLDIAGVNWLSVEGAVNFNQLPREGWRLEPGARRWDAAEVASFLNLSAMKASLEFLHRVGVGEIERHAGGLSQQIVDRLPRDRCVLRSPAEATHRGTFVVVAARTPKSTAELWQALRQRNIFVSLRQDALRIAPNIFNREWEIERLLEVLTD